ncbi:lasso peptide biosynthesis B2 protein [Kineococcus sp. SYSU DK001]|uniref:lasso peptide biosynthesis B2 protein n=1 Tax=Kineococcus sp. SYSU DK001 TaxID=3383122 RepID=UPI003D7E0248
MSEILPAAPAHLAVTDRLHVSTSVLLARWLTHRSPQQLRQHLTRIARGARPATYAEAAAARDAVLTASARTRGGSACLVRSVATALVCRARGTWPTWCVGVLAAPPFAAHAWIEADDRIVEEPTSRTDFRTFFAVTAGGTGLEPDRPTGRSTATTAGRR